MSEHGLTVYVVDDDPSIRRSTARLVRAEGYNVKVFPSAQEFLEEPPAEGPACLVLDVHMPGLDGIELQTELTRCGVRTPIIFITGRGNIPTSVRAMKAGAIEFLTKPFLQHVLLDSIRLALEKDRLARDERLETDQLRSRHETLTARECEILLLIVEGMLNKQVADRIKTSERTIKFHRAHVMQKMQAKSLPDLVRMVAKLSLTSTSKDV